MSEKNVLESLFRLVHAVKRQLQVQAEQLNLGISPMHIRVLKIIDRKSPCTAVDIASFLGRDKAQITRLVGSLMEHGLITRQPNPNDKRSHYLRTTAAGEAIVRKISTIDKKTLQLMTKDLEPEALSEFQRISQLMADNLGSQTDKADS
ncbi:MAG: MarR family transcriptional regulator [Methylophaga sp.]